MGRGIEYKEWDRNWGGRERERIRKNRRIGKRNRVERMGENLGRKRIRGSGRIG